MSAIGSPTTMDLLIGPHRGGSGRPRRVTILLIAILLLSAGDLVMTLIYLRGVGMLEANPVARVVMSFNSPAMLAAYKLATVGFTVGILYCARRTRYGEGAAWICCGVLACLTLHWARYIDTVSRLGADDIVLAQYTDARYMTMTP
jgi:hypothetical protein